MSENTQVVAGSEVETQVSPAVEVNGESNPVVTPKKVANVKKNTKKVAPKKKAVAVTPAPTKKTAAKKSAPATAAVKGTKKAAVKTAPAPTKKKATSAEGTIRSRVFHLLQMNPQGLTGGQVMGKLSLSGIPALLKDEGVRDNPRIKRETQEGVRGVLYLLTAAGKKAVEKGTVDSDAAEPSGGKEWPTKKSR